MASLDGVAVLQLAPPLLEQLLRGTAMRFFSPPERTRTPRSLSEEVVVAE